MNLFKLITALSFILFGMTQSYAQSNADAAFDEELLSVQQQWAIVNYQLKDDEKEQAFTDLLARTESWVNANNTHAEAWIWQGIIQSSYAGVAGGLGALSYAKSAKASLEKALSINESALDGSAYTSLGVLYHKVPGWPIGFGDDDLAKDNLEKALVLNPTGIDPNYFYGEFMFNEKHYQVAQDHLLLAQQAPARLNRTFADQERQKEISTLLAKVNKKLAKKK